MKTAIHWFRRDLRSTDNTALAAASGTADSVLPVYIQSEWSGSHRWTGARRQEFLCGCLDSLSRRTSCSTGGWQWSAGTGADAAPYFRIQNPWTQTARYDPNGAYIKQWLPELREVPPKKLARPPEDGQPIAKGYSTPIVDHSEARDKAFDLFKKMG